jgi:hypothetical protein
MLIAHQQNFWKIAHANTSLDPSCKIGTNALPLTPPFQFIYMGVELWANHMG